MIELGKIQKLPVEKEVEFGIYLGTPEEHVLLPKKQVPEGTAVGDTLEVFIYRDSMDRLIATTGKPLLTLGETGILKVKEMSKIGAFLDWGLEKDLFLPFKEQITKIKPEDEILVAVYTDKSDRLCATMKVYSYLRTDGHFEQGQVVDAIVYQKNEVYGVFAAIDGKYQGMIPQKDVHEDFIIGSHIIARVVEIREDGKVNLSTRREAFLEIEPDSQKILQALKDRGGELPFTDKAEPELIEQEFAMSKNAFKRAIGRLLKEGLITMTETAILLEQEPHPPVKKKPYGSDRGHGERRPYGDRIHRDGERKPYGDRDRRDGERKSYGDHDHRDGERRSYGDRDRRDGERKPYGDRDRRDGERRPYGDRDRRDGERRPYGDHDRRDGERKPYGDRDRRDGERKSYGDRDRDRRDGDRRSYGDRDHRDGERKSFGDRDRRDGDRRTYGDRDRRDGERKSYRDRDHRDGERKSYGGRNRRDGERKPYGDRNDKKTHENWDRHDDGDNE